MRSRVWIAAAIGTWLTAWFLPIAFRIRPPIYPWILLVGAVVAAGCYAAAVRPKLPSGLQFTFLSTIIGIALTAATFAAIDVVGMILIDPMIRSARTP